MHRFWLLSTHLSHSSCFRSTLPLPFPSSMYTTEVCTYQRWHLIVDGCSHMSTSDSPSLDLRRMSASSSARKIPSTGKKDALRKRPPFLRPVPHPTSTGSLGKTTRRVRCLSYAEAHAVLLDRGFLQRYFRHRDTRTVKPFQAREQTGKL